MCESRGVASGYASLSRLYVPVFLPVPTLLPRPGRALLIFVMAALGRSLGYRPWYPEFSPSGPVRLPYR